MDDVPDYLQPWLVRQRWFGGKTREPSLEIIGRFDLDNRHDDAKPYVLFVLDTAEPPLLYQVPLTSRATADPTLEPYLVATLDDGRSIYDGPHDPSFARAYLGLIARNGDAMEHRDDTGGSGRVTARGHRDPFGDGLVIRSSRVLSGEQSNTSIVFETGTDESPGAPVICKVFRSLHDGDNPDVVLTEVLDAAGSRVAPRPVGHITGQWRDTAKLHGVATGHLAFAQEFLPGTEDAWRVALRAADAGEDFSERAYALGRTTAEMHATLASALPSRATAPVDIATIVAGMRDRLDGAAREVPAIEAHREAIERRYEAAISNAWPALQRVHGDYHLGQVLWVADRGWVVLDFEGEPLRPMTERALPDIPLRDVAGMLRSFDYVAGAHAIAHEGSSVESWARTARLAFLGGYQAGSGLDLAAHHAVLDAFELDKALYEAVYESRNRPSWLPIPVEAITRLAG